MKFSPVDYPDPCLAICLQDPEDAQGDTLLLVYQPQLAESVFLNTTLEDYDRAVQVYKTYLTAVRKILLRIGTWRLVQA